MERFIATGHSLYDWIKGRVLCGEVSPGLNNAFWQAFQSISKPQDKLTGCSITHSLANLFLHNSFLFTLGQLV